MNTKPQLIVALDVETLEEARALVERLGDSVNVYKVGSQLFTACGPVIVRHLIAQGKKVFLDLKFHDIPNTVASAISSAVRLADLGHDVLDQDQNKIKRSGDGLLMCTVHTIGGREMLQRAVSAAREQAEKINVKKPLIIGITVLTSEEKADNIQQVVRERAALAKEAGLDGVVSSSQEAAMLRQEFGEDFIIVTPGIRPKDSEVGDQKRVTTPLDAVSNGSNFLVVGRPIVKASDPKKSAQHILEEMNQA